LRQLDPSFSSPVDIRILLAPEVAGCYLDFRSRFVLPRNLLSVLSIVATSLTLSIATISLQLDIDCHDQDRA
jgi:hypothetical protein